MLWTTKQGTHCRISGSKEAKHANSITESCGALAENGTRCDSNPHAKTKPHHACGKSWEVHW